MFELNDLRQTRFFQDVFEEGKEQGKQEAKKEVKLEVIPHLLAFGCSIEQIAQALDFDEEVVRQAAQPRS